MNNLYKIINLFILLIINLIVQGQQNNINNSDVIENIKLSTDRDLYFNGEKILFTADYFINNEKTYPVLSNILYVELIETQSNLQVVQKKYKITDFMVNGQIQIPENVVSGSYLLRVYTQYQKNFSVLNFSSCFLTILNPGSSHQNQAISGNTDSIYVVAEGNILLDNIENTIVIKIPGSYVSNTNKYVIMDETSTVIRELNSPVSGFIQTDISLLKSNRYKFAIVKNSGETLITELPKVHSAGIQTGTQLINNNIHYRIRTKGIKKENGNLDFQITIFSKDFGIKYTEDVILNESSLDKILPSDLLDDGINYIVLTGKDGDIKNVNSLFKPQHYNAIDIEFNKDSFKSKEKVDLHISAKNEVGHKIPVVSASVTRVGAKKEDHGFFPAIYLSNPAILENYLNSDVKLDEKLHRQIMILFDKTINTEWFATDNDYLYGKELKYIPEIRDYTITGILRDKNTKNPIPGHNVFMVALRNNPQIHVNKTGENGEFIFSVNNIYGKSDIFLCSESLGVEEDTYEILVNSPFSSEYPPVSQKVFVDDSDLELIQELYINAQIQQKFNKRQEDSLVKINQFRTFNINDDKTTVTPANYVGIRTMQELFYEIVPGVAVRKNKDQFVFEVLSEYGNILNGSPLVLVDHIPVFNPNSIMELNPSQIERIEILNKPYILGSHTFNGIIMITTNTDNFAMVKLPKSSIFTEYQALESRGVSQVVDQRYSNSPDKIPDFRTTLYWNPRIILTNNKQTINFNTSDRKGEYNIIVEGYDSEGHFYYGKKLITIE